MLKKFLFFSMVLLLLCGCNADTQNEPAPDFEFTAWTIEMEGNKDFTEQYILYSLSFTYGDGMEIKYESIEPFIAGWIEERLIDQEIISLEEVEKNHLKLKGKVTYDSKGLTKSDIIRMDEEEASILGILFETEGDEKYQAVTIQSETKLIRIGK